MDVKASQQVVSHSSKAPVNDLMKPTVLSLKSSKCTPKMCKKGNFTTVLAGISASWHPDDQLFRWESDLDWHWHILGHVFL